MIFPKFRQTPEPLVLGVFTQLLGHGGIPYAGRQAAAVIAGWASRMGLGWKILSLNDPAGPNWVELAGIKFRFEGCAGSKSRLVLKVLSVAPRARMAYLGHCAVAPLGIPLGFSRNRGYVVASYGIEAWQRLHGIGRFALKKAAAVTAISRFTAEKLSATNGIPTSKLTVIPLGLDPGFESRSCQPATALEPLKGKILLTVARLAASEQYKGIDHVIRAVALLRKRFPDLHYLIIGEGDDRPRLERLAAELAVADRVFFLGACSDGEVAFYHRACDLYVMPSKGEGFGLVYIEAMACAKPVIAASEAATPEVVVDGETGLLVGYGDLSALAQSISSLLSNPALGKKIGQAGRSRFREHYTFGRFHSRFTAFLTLQIDKQVRPSWPAKHVPYSISKFATASVITSNVGK